MYEEWILEIEKETKVKEDKIKENKTFPENREKHTSYSVAFNGEYQESLPIKDIKDVYNSSLGDQVDCLPTIPSFTKKIVIKDFYREIEELLNRNRELRIVLSVKSRDPKILGLPWELLLEDKEYHIPRRPNLLLRRCIKKIGNSNKIDLGKSKLYFTCFSKLKPPGADITGSICDEIKNINSLFEDMKIETEATKEEIKKLTSEFSFIHYGGHGRTGCIEIKDGVLYATDFKNVKSDLLFLNCCQSGSQTSFINNLCYELIKSGNFKYIIGMQYKIEDKYALDFAQKFYEKLEKNNGDALRALLGTQETVHIPPTGQSHLIPVIYQN